MLPGLCPHCFTLQDASKRRILLARNSRGFQLREAELEAPTYTKTAREHSRGQMREDLLPDFRRPTSCHEKTWAGFRDGQGYPRLLGNVLRDAGRACVHQLCITELALCSGMRWSRECVYRGNRARGVRHVHFRRTVSIVLQDWRCLRLRGLQRERDSIGCRWLRAGKFCGVSGIQIRRRGGGSLARLPTVGVGHECRARVYGLSGSVSRASSAHSWRRRIESGCGSVEGKKVGEWVVAAQSPVQGEEALNQGRAGTMKKRASGTYGAQGRSRGRQRRGVRM